MLHGCWLKRPIEIVCMVDLHWMQYTVRRIIRNCARYARFWAQTIEQLMGPLPAVRLSPTRPFTYTGVDFAGPLMLKATKLRGGLRFYKGYVSLFICLVVKAMHIQIVTDLTREVAQKYDSFGFCFCSRCFSSIWQLIMKWFHRNRKLFWIQLYKKHCNKRLTRSSEGSICAIPLKSL